MIHYLAQKFVLSRIMPLFYSLHISCTACVLQHIFDPNFQPTYHGRNFFPRLRSLSLLSAHLLAIALSANPPSLCLLASHPLLLRRIQSLSSHSLSACISDPNVCQVKEIPNSSFGREMPQYQTDIIPDDDFEIRFICFPWAWEHRTVHHGFAPADEGAALGVVFFVMLCRWSFPCEQTTHEIEAYELEDANKARIPQDIDSTQCTVHRRNKIPEITVLSGIQQSN